MLTVHIYTSSLGLLRRSTYGMVQLPRPLDCKVLTHRRSRQNDEASSSAKASTSDTIETELTKGLSYAAQSHTALDEQERLTLLAEPENAYQNALGLLMKAGKLTGSPIAKRLEQLRNFLNK